MCFNPSQKAADSGYAKLVTSQTLPLSPAQSNKQKLVRQRDLIAFPNFGFTFRTNAAWKKLTNLLSGCSTQVCLINLPFYKSIRFIL
jgi:hypothetical protein